MPNDEKNPLLKNGFFFFSNMYDDKLLTEFYPKICRESWMNSVQSQYDSIGRKRKKDYNPSLVGAASLKELSINDKLNSRLKLPLGSSIIKLSNVVIPYHNKKAYIRKYGATTRKIPLDDFIINNNIFDGIISVYLGRFRIQKAYIIENNDQSVYLAIPNSTSNGIPKAMLQQMISDASGDNGGDLANNTYKSYPTVDDTSTLILIFNEELCRSFHYSGEKNVLFSTTAEDGYYKMTLPLSTEISKIKPQNIYEEANSWDLYITANESKYGLNALIGDAITLDQQLSDRIIFKVKEEFVNYIKTQTKTNVEVFVMKRQNRRYINIYSSIADYTGAFSYLPFTFNPASMITFAIYKYDNVNHCRLGRIDFSLHKLLADTPIENISFYGIQQYFPNIISFDVIFEILKTSKIGSIEIEIYEYYPSHTQQTMHNGLTEIIGNLTPDFYTKCVVNHYLDPINLSDFSPTLHRVSTDDYINSIYYGDIRAYFCSKIISMLESDPSLIKEYYSFMENLHRSIYSVDGTPKSLKFGTNKSGEHKGKHEIVRDTSIASSIIDDVQHFEEDHSYIIYHSSDDKIPSMFFVNGKYVEPTCYRYYKGEMYLFFPVKIMDELDIYDDSQLKKVKPLRIEWFPNAYMTYAETPKDSFTITSLDQQIRLFDHIKNPLFKLSNLTFYDNATHEYIDIHDAFDIIYEANQVIVDNPLIQDPIIIDRAENSKQYLYTVLNEIYCTKDSQPIILGENTVEISYDDEVDNINMGIPKGSFDNKILDFTKIYLVPKDSSLIGKTINVFANNFKHTIYLSGKDGVYDESSNSTTFTITNGCVDNVNIDYENIAIFVNGYRINQYDFIFDNNANRYHNGILKIKINRQFNPDDDIKIIHTPIRFNIMDIYPVSYLTYLSEANKDGTSISTIWNVPNRSENKVAYMVDPIPKRMSYLPIIYTSQEGNESNIYLSPASKEGNDEYIKIKTGDIYTNSLIATCYNSDYLDLLKITTTEKTGISIIPITDIAMITSVTINDKCFLETSMPS